MSLQLTFWSFHHWRVDGEAKKQIPKNKEEMRRNPEYLIMIVFEGSMYLYVGEMTETVHIRLMQSLQHVPLGKKEPEPRKLMRGTNLMYTS